MRILTAIFSLLICTTSYANMANPVLPGTLGGRPFVNQYVDVVHEDLFIKIDKVFETAQFNVKYHINSSKDGVHIPFLFYASAYLDDFTVKVDGKEVSVSPIPDEYEVPNYTKFDNFSYFFEPRPSSNRSTVTLWQSGSGGRILSMNDFIYFETDISEGEHVIEVSYKASRWTNTSSWINEYSFRYALSPAKYWKSFGTLTIELDATDYDKAITSNLGKPSSGKIDSISTWEFNKLPIDVAQWSYQPKKKSVVKTLTKIGPFGLALFTGIFFSILHFIWLVWYRKKFPEKKFSLALIIGSVLIPLIFVLSWTNYYSIIDYFIGEHAGKYHGYTFFVVLLYPVILIVYWIIFWLIDSDLKRNSQKENKIVRPTFSLHDKRRKIQ